MGLGLMQLQCGLLPPSPSVTKKANDFLGREMVSNTSRQDQGWRQDRCWVDTVELIFQNDHRAVLSPTE